MTYGLECAFTCSRCRNGTPCHHEDGTCLQGCDEGLYGGTCKSGMYTFIFFPNKNKKKPNGIGVFLVVFIIYFSRCPSAACISSVLSYTLSVTVWTFSLLLYRYNLNII